MSISEKKLRVIDMNDCGWIPCRLVVYSTAWNKYREKLEGPLARYTKLFPAFKRGSVNLRFQIQSQRAKF